MMGCQSRQMTLVFVDKESLIPENHLLRNVDRAIFFDPSMIIWHHIIRRLVIHLSTLDNRPPPWASQSHPRLQG